jgi:hypothetical protein
MGNLFNKIDNAACENEDGHIQELLCGKIQNILKNKQQIDNAAFEDGTSNLAIF